MTTGALTAHPTMARQGMCRIYKIPENIKRYITQLESSELVLGTKKT